MDRTGEHHLWLGSKKADGTGKLKVGGKTLTAPRVAWELLHGPLEAGRRVKPCPAERACVRIEHLSLSSQPRRRNGRSRKGGGSARKVRDGVYKLTVPAGRYASGKPRRESRTVYVDTDEEATRALAELLTEVADGRAPVSEAERDITMDAAVERYLTEYLLEEKGRAEKTVRNYRSFHNTWFAPYVGGGAGCGTWRRRTSTASPGGFEPLAGARIVSGMWRISTPRSFGGLSDAGSCDAVR